MLRPYGMGRYLSATPLTESGRSVVKLGKSAIEGGGNGTAIGKSATECGRNGTTFGSKIKVTLILTGL